MRYPPIRWLCAPYWRSFERRISPSPSSISPRQTPSTSSRRCRTQKAEVLDETDPTSREELTQHLPQQALVEATREMPPDEAADLLELLSEDRRQQVLRQLEPEAATVLRRVHVVERAGGV